MEPLLTVITVNYNNLSGLEQTLLSVSKQTRRNFELLVIDGGSDDGSVELIRSNAQMVNYWVSEKDSGVYDAQNKGIKKARGQYVIFLNSGDSFYSDDVTLQFQRHCSNTSILLYYGNSFLLKPKGETEILTPPALLNNAYFFRNAINHQACFIKREAFSLYGFYNPDFKICADFDFLLRLFTSEPEQFLYLPMMVCRYDQSGISSRSSNYDRLEMERDEILKKHLGKKEFHRLRQQYEDTLPFKQRILLKLYRIPMLGNALKAALRSAFPHERTA